MEVVSSFLFRLEQGENCSSVAYSYRALRYWIFSWPVLAPFIQVRRPSCFLIHAVRSLF